MVPEELEPTQTHPFVSWLGGCFTGCLLGAVGGPIAFVLLLFLQDWLVPNTDPDAGDGVLFWLVLSVPAGAIGGAIVFPIARELVGLAVEEIKYRRNRD